MKLSIAQMSKYISFVLCVITLVMTIGCGRNAPPPASPALSLEDEASIYAAVVRQLATVDDTFGGNLEPTKLFIIKNTDDKAGDPTGSSSFSTAIPQTAQDKITDMLHDLSSIIVWIDKFEDAEFEEGKLPGLEKLPIQKESLCIEAITTTSGCTGILVRRNQKWLSLNYQPLKNSRKKR